MPLLLNDRTPLLSRDEWGARPPKSVASSNPDEGCTDHWEGTSMWNTANIGDHSRCAPAIRGIQRYHMDGQGWSDIAYNFIVCPHGYVYTGRGFNRGGANGTAYWNMHTYQVCWLTGLGDPMPDPIRDIMSIAVRDTMDWCIWAGRANPTKRNAHRDIRATMCPGDLINWVSKNNYGVVPRPTPPPPQETAIVVNSASHPIKGYWIVDEKGFVTAHGCEHHKDLRDIPLVKPIVAMCSTATGNGYWLAAADGGVFAFGDARFYGSMGGSKLNSPVVDIDRSPSGKGYRLVAADGGVFNFGDDKFYGSRAG